MNLIEPGRTPWDLQFNVAGIPVRVHPMFWLMSLLVVGIGNTTGVALIIGLVIVFVSILVHELGHAFTMRYYGEQARVVLYFMGGLAITGGDSIWDLGYRQRARSPQQQIIISAAGPAAGFALAALTVAFIYAMGMAVEVIWFKGLPVFVINTYDKSISWEAEFGLRIILWINIFWGLINLLPVYPLDGGQIARQIFLLRNPYEGLTQSLWLSLVVAAAMAIFGLSRGDIWIGVLFGSMAFGNWQMLQNAGYGGRPW